MLSLVAFIVILVLLFQLINSHRSSLNLLDRADGRLDLTICCCCFYFHTDAERWQTSDGRGEGTGRHRSRGLPDRRLDGGVITITLNLTI